MDKKFLDSILDYVDSGDDDILDVLGELVSRIVALEDKLDSVAQNAVKGAAAWALQQPLG